MVSGLGCVVNVLDGWMDEPHQSPPPKTNKHTNIIPGTEGSGSRGARARVPPSGACARRERGGSGGGARPVVLVVCGSGVLMFWVGLVDV